jgi:integrase/recombinase XerD
MTHRLIDHVHQFLKSLEAARYSERTLEGYQLALTRLVESLEAQGIDCVTSITPEALITCQQEMLTRTNRAHRPVSVATVASFTSDVRMFFRYLVKHRYVLINPAQDLEVPRQAIRPPNRVLDLASVKRLLQVPRTKTVQGLRDRAILEVLYSTGIRVTELISLQVHDINLADHELLVREGKGRKTRLIPIGSAACVWVERYLERSWPRLLRKRGDTTLFLSARGRRLHRVLVARILRGYGRAARTSIPVTPHVLRHTFATHMLRGKASLRHLQEMLGHKRLTTTQIYTKVDISDLKAVHRRCHPRGLH